MQSSTGNYSVVVSDIEAQNFAEISLQPGRGIFLPGASWRIPDQGFSVLFCFLKFGVDGYGGFENQLLPELLFDLLNRRLADAGSQVDLVDEQSQKGKVRVDVAFDAFDMLDRRDQTVQGISRAGLWAQ